MSLSGHSTPDAKRRYVKRTDAQHLTAPDGRPYPLAEGDRLSDVDLLRNLDRIIHFDAVVPNGALDLGMNVGSF